MEGRLNISKSDIKFVRSLQHKKYRDESGCFVAEGDKCVGELLGYFELEKMFRADELSAKQLEQLSALRSPQGAVAVFKKREQELPSLSSLSCELTLVLDGVQDPGNLGTIIRTADWFGVKRIICSADTADCYNPKVVQATMGALARVSVFYTDLPDVLSRNKATAQIPVYGTLLNGRNMYQNGAICRSDDDTGVSGLLIMGNEGNGISASVREYITHPLFIPSYPAGAKTSESLNVAVATAVVLAEMRR